MKDYVNVLKKYFDFHGRARRREYWMFVLFNVLISWLLMLLYVSVGSAVFGVLSGVYSLAVLCPAIGVTVRRLHDTGKSGWWYFIALIPLAGAIWLLIILCTDGQREENKYGADPKVA